MIDLHTHILPKVDDGSKSVEESLEMLRMEAAQGIRQVALTPHFYAVEDSPQRFLDRRSRAMERLAPHLTERMPRLHLGAEVQYFEGICGATQVEDLRMEDSWLFLLEMPFDTWTNRMAEDVLALNSHPQMQVVLAHVERYLPFHNAVMLQELLQEGVLAQANTSFFIRWQTRNQALKMLKAGQIRFLGSDCHNRDTRKPNWDQLPEKVLDLLKPNYTYN